MELAYLHDMLWFVYDVWALHSNWSKLFAWLKQDSVWHVSDSIPSHKPVYTSHSCEVETIHCANDLVPPSLSKNRKKMCGLRLKYIFKCRYALILGSEEEISWETGVNSSQEPFKWYWFNFFIATVLWPGFIGFIKIFVLLSFGWHKQDYQWCGQWLESGLLLWFWIVFKFYL